jgi:hypothetical protein
MNRRQFGLLGACSAAALGTGLPRMARAGVPAERAAQLKTTLTPFGAERAGNADGSIPAWNGGLTQTLPGWSSGQQQPDYFASDAVLLTIDKSNVAQYTSMVSDGIAAMIQKYDGFEIKVYPTHRTAAAPQWVYDNMYQNALNSALDPRGGRFGFSGAYGGNAFPILDSDPDIAGAQVIWNHITRWDGTNTSAHFSTYVASKGDVVLANILNLKYFFPYYRQDGNLANFDGWYQKAHIEYTAPAVDVGQVLCAWSSTNELNQPTQSWELLSGQGRVRKAPNVTYDTPESTAGGIINFDEAYGFYGAPNRYNWKLLDKREMYVPYNDNALLLSNPKEVLKANYLDPSVVRYEKHRVYVVDATLAPGERHTIPHRRIYVDEDSWRILLADEWDANGNLLKVNQVFTTNYPDLPGTIFGQEVLNNIQSDQYVVGPGLFTTASNPGFSFAPINQEIFNPQFISASAQF